MKKLYMVGLLLITASLAGCTLKGPVIPELFTGGVQGTTGTEFTGIKLTGGELTGTLTTGTTAEALSPSIDSGVVPMATGSEDVAAIQSGVVTEVKKLIEERNTQPKDETKLTEEDISLMEKAIQTISNLFKR